MVRIYKRSRCVKGLGMWLRTWLKLIRALRTILGTLGATLWCKSSIWCPELILKQFMIETLTWLNRLWTPGTCLPYQRTRSRLKKSQKRSNLKIILICKQTSHHLCRFPKKEPLTASLQLVWSKALFNRREQMISRRFWTKVALSERIKAITEQLRSQAKWRYQHQLRNQSR